MNVNELEDDLLETRSWFAESFPNEDDLRRIYAIDKAIEAIKVLQEIASKVGAIPHDGLAIKAQAWINSLEAK